MLASVAKLPLTSSEPSGCSASEGGFNGTVAVQPRQVRADEALYGGKGTTDENFSIGLERHGREAAGGPDIETEVQSAVGPKAFEGTCAAIIAAARLAALAH